MMKKCQIYRHIASIYILLMLSAGVFAQTDTIRVFSPSQTILCNSIVDIPVRATRFKSMLSMQGSLFWDSTVIRFDSIASYGPAALDLQSANFGLTQTSSGKLFFSWNDPTLKSVSLADSTTLFTLRFKVLATSPATTSVTMGGDVVPLEFLDTSYAAVPSKGSSTSIALQFRIPNFNPFADTTRVCGTSILLDAGADYSQFIWSNGNDGRKATVSSNGIYTLAVKNALNCVAEDQTLVSLVTADIRQADTAVCRFSPLVLIGQSGSGWQYQWSTNSDKSSISITPSVTTIYKLTITDGITTCTDSVKITVEPVDTSLSIRGPLTFCATRDSVVLTLAQSAGYQWLRDGQVISGATAQTYRPDTTGLYRAVIRNSLGCTDSTRTVSVTINPLPKTALLSVGDSLLCEGGTRLLTATGAATYRWYRNDTLIANLTKDSLTLALPGRYRVEGISSAGCVQQAANSVTFTLAPKPKLNFSITGICVDVPITFNNLSDTTRYGTNSWLWSFGNGDSSNAFSTEYIYKTTADYQVKLRYSNSRCSNHRDSLAKPFTPIRLPNLRFADQIAILGIPKSISARDTASKWAWRPATGLSATNILSPQATLQLDQQYVIQTTMRSGCIVYDTLLVKVAGKPGIHVPKAFTPNGDGKNDRLFPVLIGINQLQYFRVYNRWGVLMYEVRQSGGSNIGWDGVYKGSLQPMETYIWIAEAVDVMGKTIKAGGNSVLIR